MKKNLFSVISRIPALKKGVHYMYPRIGDAIVFDYRLTHRGQGPADEHEVVADGQQPVAALRRDGTGSHRMLLQLSYGLNNQHSKKLGPFNASPLLSGITRAVVL